ncbi:hypothetical protein SUGI_0273660 [Cryptomeria japonica]|nr:hypothetical protein SUGI_0273660 [Cryptomeria japonica]
MGLIGHFQGFLSSLGELHKWIIECWRSILVGDVHIYPCAHGFFVVVFDSVQDIDSILCKHLWSWEDKHTLLIKPWYIELKTLIESFTKIPTWVRIPNLMLQNMFDSCFIAIGNSFGCFLGVDEGYIDFMHTTYARIFVEMDMSANLPAELLLNFVKGCWLHLVDCEGIPLKCRWCFQIGHLAAKCVKRKTINKTTWWRDVVTHRCLVEKDDAITHKSLDGEGIIETIKEKKFENKSKVKVKEGIRAKSNS